MLISVNPFKQLPIYTEKEIDQYKGAVSDGRIMSFNESDVDLVDSGIVE